MTGPNGSGWPRDPRGRPLDHVGIAVHRLDDAAYWALLGIPAGEDESLPAQGVAVRWLHAGPVAIELLAPLDEEGPLARFLARRGPGLHHVALRVDDLPAELSRLEAEGAELVDRAPRPGGGGSRVAFLHPRWSGGVLVELVEPPRG